MVHDTVLEVGPTTISLQSGAMLDYEFLMLATGSYAGAPSRLNVNKKEDGIETLQLLQGRIEKANDLVVVGAGAAGVELASDAKSVYPQKNVTLVHSRKTLLNSFGTKLHNVALEALEKLGVRVVVDERIGSHGEGDEKVVLGSGETVPCDLLVCHPSLILKLWWEADVPKIRCTGQKAASDIIAKLCPDAISSRGDFVKVKPTLQIADDRFNGIFAAGDIIVSTGTANGRSAMQQAAIVSNNIIRAIRGRPLVTYQPNILMEDGIELTLGIVSTD